MRLVPKFDFFKRRRDYGALFVRLVVGLILVHQSQDNVFSHARMLEFRDFLAARHIPWPLLAAHVSVYAQFICGILYLVGLFVRPAALVMIINFVAALLIAHLGHLGGDRIEGAFLALVMLFSSLFLLFNGAGKPSIDDRMGN
jgi:putative oxidoreductase